MMKKTISILLIAFILTTSSLHAEERIQYREIKMGNYASCSVGLVYRYTEGGMEVETAAIATGKGADFRRWQVYDTKLEVNRNYIRPAQFDNFYTTRESIWRWPAAVVFAAIGSQYWRSAAAGSGVSQVMGTAGMAVGLGLLVTQAKGEVTGQKSLFKLDRETEEKLEAGPSSVRVVVEDRKTGRRVRLKTDISPSEAEASNPEDVQPEDKASKTKDHFGRKPIVEQDVEQALIDQSKDQGSKIKNIDQK